MRTLYDLTDRIESALEEREELLDDLSHKIETAIQALDDLSKSLRTEQPDAMDQLRAIVANEFPARSLTAGNRGRS